MGDRAPQNLRGAGPGYYPTHDTAQTRAHWAGNPVAYRSLDRCDAAHACDARAPRRRNASDVCRRDPVIGTQATPSDLPQAKTDTQHKETTPAPNPSSPKALILRDRRHTVRTADIHRAIVSKDEGVLTALSPSFLRKQEPRSSESNARSPWLPALRFAPAGMTSFKAPPSLRSSRRKSGSRAPSVMLGGLHTQP